MLEKQLGLFLLASIALVWVILPTLFKFSKHTLVSRAPVVGRKWWFEPLFVTRYRFILNGWSITKEGWQTYPNSAFTIVRPDSNVTVLPNRYVDELQNMHDHKLNPIEALSEDMHGSYTGMTILVGSHLSFNAVRNKLTPRLGRILPALVDEIDYGLGIEIPSCKDTWVAVNLTKIMTCIISSLTSRSWVGLSLCRNEEWHAANIFTTEQIFFTALILKCLPAAIQPLIAPMLPMRRKLQQGLNRIRSFLVPLIEERRRREIEGEGYEKVEDVLQWMMDGAEGEEWEAENLATRYAFAVIGSLFTVSAGLVDCIYDLTARPEYLEPLRQEIRKTLKEDGGWCKNTPSKLVKLDSFMKESQRINAPSPISFKRIVKEQLTLSDGLVLPKGAYICVVNTSSIGREADRFDGFRYSKMREDSASMTRHQYSSTDRDHITFGHGRFACPGRFAAALEIKLVLATMLARYDFKFEDGRGRPPNLQFLELGFQNPAEKIYIREAL